MDGRAARRLRTWWAGLRPDSRRTQKLAERLSGLLEDADETVATAESLTGGRLAALFTATPGASRSYLGGVVAYATPIKTDLLGVPDRLVGAHGVISAECASAMAANVRELLGATWGVSTTGVAGPTPQEGHPPGTVFVAVAGPEGTQHLALELTGDRAAIQDRTCAEAVRLLSGLVSRPGAPRLRAEETGLG